MVISNVTQGQREADAASPPAVHAAWLDRQADIALSFGFVNRAELLAHRAEELRKRETAR